MSNAISNRHRLDISGRIIAAILLGYLFANTASVFIGLILPMGKPSAVLTAALSSFALYTGIIMWIFHVKTLKKMWWGLILGMTATATAGWLLYLVEAGN